MPVPIIIQCQDELGKLLLSEASERGITIQAVIVERLAKSFGIECEPPKRGRPWPKKTGDDRTPDVEQRTTQQEQ